MKDKDGLYDDSGEGIYTAKKPYKATIPFGPAGTGKYFVNGKEVTEDDVAKAWDDTFFDRQRDLDDLKRMDKERNQEKWRNRGTPSQFSLPIKYFIGDLEVRQSDIENHRDKLTYAYVKHNDGFDEVHYSEIPWYQLPTEQAREEYNAKYWKQKEEKYQKWAEAVSTSKSNFDYDSYNDWWKKESWGDKARQMERDQSLLKEEQMKNLKSKLQRLEKEALVLSEKLQKSINENIELRKKIELFEKDPDEYQRRKTVDPYGEENWEK